MFQIGNCQAELPRNGLPYVIKLIALLAVIGIWSVISTGKLAFLKSIIWGMSMSMFCNIVIHVHLNQIKQSYADLPLIRLPLNTVDRCCFSSGSLKNVCSLSFENKSVDKPNCVDMSNCTDLESPPGSRHVQSQSRPLDWFPGNTDHIDMLDSCKNGM